jgi:hypothetical protein
VQARLLVYFLDKPIDIRRKAVKCKRIKGMEKSSTEKELEGKLSNVKEKKEWKKVVPRRSIEFVIFYMGGLAVR